MGKRLTGSNRIGWGGAQTGKIYTVNATTSNTITCEAQPYAPPVGYAWPSSLLSTVLPIADDYQSRSSSVTQASSTGSVTPTGSAAPTETGKSGGLSTGATAGIGAGVGCLALAGLGVLVWWLWKRKRTRAASDQRGYEAGSEKGKPGRFDMLAPPKHADSYGHSATKEGDEPRVEPFRSHSDYARSSLPVQGYAAGAAGTAGLSVPLHSPGPSSEGGTDYANVNPLENASFAMPTPQPSGSAPAPSESDGLSRGPTGTAFYYVPPSGAGGSAVDIARSPSHASDLGQQQGAPGLMPPGTMLRGPVSAAAEKARLSQQYAQLERGAAEADADASAPQSSSSMSPLTPPGPFAQQFQAFGAPQPATHEQVLTRVDSPAARAQARVSVISPQVAVESHHGDVAQSRPKSQQQTPQDATDRRHTDGGELHDENRPDVGQVDLPPL